MLDQKKNIVQQGFSIIFNEGLRAFTVDRLSNVLHVSKKTIYSLFSTKEILIDGIIKHKLSEIDKGIEAILKKNKCPIRSFYEINQYQVEVSSDIDINKLIELKIKYPDIWNRIEKHRKNHFEVIKKIFRSAKSSGYLRKSLDVDSISKLYINIVDKAFQPEFFIQQDMSLKETIVLFSNIMANGIFNEKGIKVLSEINRADNA
tara:strand:- start:1274 stop:1885 length:612 start_codon:yes stop_codon:yes gene_type:complete